MEVLMGTALYTNETNEGSTICPFHPNQATPWLDDLPASLKDLVVPPVSFKVAREYDMLADHTQGCDDTNRPCYCEFRFVLTQLRSDDDEVFYESPVYAESLTSWRLVDDRWLVCKTTVGSFEHVGSQPRFSISDAMPG
jgi:hypothetical protein